MKYNPFEILIDDHKKLKNVMKSIEDKIINDDTDLSDDFNKFKDIFHMHDKSEDDIIYPALKEYKELKKTILKSYQAHHMVEMGILELKITPYVSETWGPKFLVVKDCILSHMAEEEDFLFKKAAKIVKQEDINSFGEKLHNERES